MPWWRTRCSPGARWRSQGKPLSQARFAVARTQLLDSLDLPVAQAFEAALRTLRNAGARVEEIALDEIRDLGTIQATGGFSAAESYAWHRELLASKAADYDPRVRHRIERGAGMKAWEYLELVRARADWIACVGRALQGFDAVLSPTVPDRRAPDRGRGARRAARRGLLPRQRAPAAQYQRGEHAGRLRDLAALPRTREPAGRPHAVARRDARRRASSTWHSRPRRRCMLPARA
jgi:Asp-tRNA(Asn)/Glu-tRNA(Gln) amidotransferase A subunit family amidase